MALLLLLLLQWPLHPSRAMDGAWRRPPKSVSDCGHAEPQRGTECWGEDFLVTFDWAGIPVLAKVTRRKGGTIGRRYPNNGYVHSQKNALRSNIVQAHQVDAIAGKPAPTY
ncbi:hypothetical protein [Pseudomonas sp. FP2338]|uniref:hypothetical protein n=1 Tax=Pseudomonas sp. FP2338 TaxID=2954093 RepID=UPI0027352C02|nr:hypothetical protein [Pseudomonas sp. FP2338]WLH87454.1 hypothetical protein PSH96_13690 [Pseudomonas sp. FP2338]